MVQCSFCDSTKPCAEKTNEHNVDMLQIIIPNFNSEDYTNNICLDCDALITDIFKFKSSYWELENSLYNYKSEDAAEINLEKIVGLEGLCKGKLCRACLEVIEDDSFVELNNGDSLIENYKKECLSDSNFFLTKDPVMCNSCIGMLEKYFGFLQRFENHKKTVKSKTDKDCQSTIELNKAQQRFSEGENDSDDISLYTEIFEDVKEEISIEEHSIENHDPTVFSKNSCNPISDTNCDIEEEIASNNTNNYNTSSNLTQHNHLTRKEVLDIIEGTSTSNSLADNHSPLCKETDFAEEINEPPNINIPLTLDIVDKSNKNDMQHETNPHDTILSLSDSSTNTSENHNKRKRISAQTQILISDDDSTPTESNSAQTDASQNSKRRRSKRKVKNTKYYREAEDDSDFNPEIEGEETESEEDYFSEKTKKYSLRNSNRLKSPVSAFKGRSVTQLRQIAPKPVCVGMDVNKRKKSVFPGIIRSNPLLAALLTDSDTDSVDSETESLLKSLLKTHQTLPDPRKSNLQKFSKTEQNFLIQKLRDHPALPEPTVDILKKIAETKTKRKSAQRHKQRKKPLTEAAQAGSTQPSDIVIQIDTTPGQNNWATLNTPSTSSNLNITPAPSSNLFIAYPQRGLVPNQQLIIWPVGAAAPQSAEHSILNAVTTSTTQTQYCNITSTSASANVPSQPAPTTTYRADGSHISVNMKSLIMNYLNTKFSGQPNISQAFNVQYASGKSETKPPVSSAVSVSADKHVQSCIDLTFDDPGDPDQLGTIAEELIIPDVVADEPLDKPVDADPLSVNAEAARTDGSLMAEETSTAVEGLLASVVNTADSENTKGIDVNVIDEQNTLAPNSQSDKTHVSPAPTLDTPTTHKINETNKDKDDPEINTLMSDLEQVLATSESDKNKTVGIDTDDEFDNAGNDRESSDENTLDQNSVSNSAAKDVTTDISTNNSEQIVNTNSDFQGLRGLLLSNEFYPTIKNLSGSGNKADTIGAKDNQSPSVSTGTVDVTIEIVDDDQPKSNRPDDSLPSTSTATADVTTEMVDDLSTQNRRADDDSPASVADVVIDVGDKKSKPSKRKLPRRLPPISARTTNVTIEIDSDGDISSVMAPAVNGGPRLLYSNMNKMAERTMTMALNNHLSCPYELAVFKCESCAFNTRYFRLIEEHSLTHFEMFRKLDAYECTHCLETHAKKNLLSTHLQKEHNQFYYRLWFWCVNCTTSFAKHPDVLRHHKTCQKKHLSVNLFKSNYTVFCMLCYFETNNVEKARSHSKKCYTRHVKKPIEVIELD